MDKTSEAFTLVCHEDGKLSYSCNRCGYMDFIRFTSSHWPYCYACYGDFESDKSKPRRRNHKPN